MDELSMVRELLAAPLPPGPEVTARARRQLSERMGGSKQAAIRRWPWRARWTAGLVGVTAAALAGSLVVTTGLAGSWLGHSGGRFRTGSGLITSERPFGALNGRLAGTYLTALAVRLAQVPAGTGRYWCTTGVTGTLDPIGPGGRELTRPGLGKKPTPASDYRYTIISRQAMDDCLSVSGNSTRNVGGYFQDLGAQPATAADVTAWRRDGSPAWQASFPSDQPIPAQPGPRHRLGGKPGQQPWGAVLLSYAQRDNQNLFQEAWLLLEDPVSPAVRAAAYRVLATVPGVHVKTGVTDPDGRRGTALWLGTGQDPTGDLTDIIVVDPANGLLLAFEFLQRQSNGIYAAGTLSQYLTWRYTGWASRLPASSAP